MDVSETLQNLSPRPGEKGLPPPPLALSEFPEPPVETGGLKPPLSKPDEESKNFLRPSASRSAWADFFWPWRPA